MSTYVKGRSKTITSNFRTTEFDCKGKGCCSKTIIEDDFVRLLQNFRNYLNYRIGPGITINVNSGYRCEVHNKEIGGSSTSKHCLGKAADIFVKKNGSIVDAKHVCCLAQDFGFNGIEYIDSGALHVDNRNYKWRTYQLDRTYHDVGDFYTWTGRKREAIPYRYTETVKKGSRGSSVYYVKYFLFALGYLNVKPSNSICGSSTVTAIKKFQKENGLTSDGKFGPDSFKKSKEIW